MIISINKVNDLFQSAYEEVNKNFSCNYLSYIYQYNSFKLSFVTHFEWMNLYINKSLMNNCPLIRVGLEKIAASKTKNVILRWNDVIPISKEEKNINGVRSEFNICNGISFGRKIFGASDYFGLASDIKNLDFPRDIIAQSTRIREIMNNLFQASTAKLFQEQISELH